MCEYKLNTITLQNYIKNVCFNFTIQIFVYKSANKLKILFIIYSKYYNYYSVDKIIFKGTIFCLNKPPIKSLTYRGLRFWKLIIKN